jgi:hypothetical protein
MAAVDINVFGKPLTIGRGIPKHFRGFLEALQMCGKQVLFERRVLTETVKIRSSKAY